MVQRRNPDFYEWCKNKADDYRWDLSDGGLKQLRQLLMEAYELGKEGSSLLAIAKTCVPHFEWQRDDNWTGPGEIVHAEPEKISNKDLEALSELPKGCDLAVDAQDHIVVTLTRGDA